MRRHVAKLGDTGRHPFAIFDQDDTKNVMKLALKKHFSLKQGSVAAPPAAAINELADDAAGEADDAVSEADDASSKQPPLHEWVTAFTALLAGWGPVWQILKPSLGQSQTELMA